MFSKKLKKNYKAKYLICDYDKFIALLSSLFAMNRYVLFLDYESINMIGYKTKEKKT